MFEEKNIRGIVTRRRNVRHMLHQPDQLSAVGQCIAEIRAVARGGSLKIMGRGQARFEGPKPEA